MVRLAHFYLLCWQWLTTSLVHQRRQRRFEKVCPKKFCRVNYWWTTTELYLNLPIEKKQK